MYIHNKKITHLSSKSTAKNQRVSDHKIQLSYYITPQFVKDINIVEAPLKKNWTLMCVLYDDVQMDH